MNREITFDEVNLDDILLIAYKSAFNRVSTNVGFVTQISPISLSLSNTQFIDEYSHVDIFYKNEIQRIILLGEY